MASSNVFGNPAWDGRVFGVFIPDDPSSDATVTVREAFNAVGIDFSTKALPPAGMGFGSSIQNAPTLFVGSKPIPAPQ
jgi:hypothetical protein